MKSFAHVLKFKSFIVHITFYSINGVTFYNVFFNYLPYKENDDVINNHDFK